MTKSKFYKHVFFRPEHLSKISAEFMMRVDSATRDKLTLIMKATLPAEAWNHESEAEFFSDIRKKLCFAFVVPGFCWQRGLHDQRQFVSCGRVNSHHELSADLAEMFWAKENVFVKLALCHGVAGLRSE